MFPLLMGVAGLGAGSFFGAQLDDAFEDTTKTVETVTASKVPFFGGINKTVLFIVAAGLVVAYLKYKK